MPDTNARRNHVRFQTRRFKSADPKCESPSCFGEDVARWLLAQLGETPIRFDAPIEEDYGWGFWCEGDYWVAIGMTDETSGSDPAEWLVSVDYDPGLNLKKRLFGKADRALHAQICAAIHAALVADSEITGVRWCNDGERDCGETPS